MNQIVDEIETLQGMWAKYGSKGELPSQVVDKLCVQIDEFKSRLSSVPSSDLDNATAKTIYSLIDDTVHKCQTQNTIDTSVLERIADLLRTAIDRYADQFIRQVL